MKAPKSTLYPRQPSWSSGRHEDVAGGLAAAASFSTIIAPLWWGVRGFVSSILFWNVRSSHYWLQVGLQHQLTGT